MQPQEPNTPPSFSMPMLDKQLGLSYSQPSSLNELRQQYDENVLKRMFNAKLNECKKLQKENEKLKQRIEESKQTKYAASIINTQPKQVVRCFLCKILGQEEKDLGAPLTPGQAASFLYSIDFPDTAEHDFGDAYNTSEKQAKLRAQCAVAIITQNPARLCNGQHNGIDTTLEHFDQDSRAYNLIRSNTELPHFNVINLLEQHETNLEKIVSEYQFSARLLDPVPIQKTVQTIKEEQVEEINELRSQIVTLRRKVKKWKQKARQAQVDEITSQNTDNDDDDDVNDEDSVLGSSQDEEDEPPKKKQKQAATCNEKACDGSPSESCAFCLDKFCTEHVTVCHKCGVEGACVSCLDDRADHEQCDECEHFFLSDCKEVVKKIEKINPITKEKSTFFWCPECLKIKT